MMFRWTCDEDESLWLECEHVEGLSGDREVEHEGEPAQLLRMERGRMSASLRTWIEGRGALLRDMECVISGRDGVGLTRFEVWRAAPLFAWGGDGEWFESCVWVCEPRVVLSVKAFEQWRYWREEPASLGEWAGWGFDARFEWLQRVREHHSFAMPERMIEEGGCYELDGLGIRDYPSFFLALGEALCGPRGYYGGGLDALCDCLCGGFGPVPPMTLIWHHSATSRAHLDHATWTRAHLAHIQNTVEVAVNLKASGEGRAIFDVILETFEERGVDVELR